MPRSPHDPCPCTNRAYKLHPADVQEIRRLRRYYPQAWTTKLVARAFRVSASHVSNLCCGRFWRDV